MSLADSHSQLSPAIDGGVLVRVSDLCISTTEGRKLVHDVSFEIRRGRVLGLVGESGSGKSLTALAMLRLTPDSLRVSGRIDIDGTDVLRVDRPMLRHLRGGEVGFIFQDPLSALNPTMRIGQQIAEVAQLHRRLGKSDALEVALELLREVRIPDPRGHARAYPHQLSGGMRQRVGAAIALAGDPKLLIADEPTTALDVSVQAQFLRLLHRLRAERSLTVILITHDLGVAAQLCDDIAVMYQGRVMEMGPCGEIMRTPLVPYTKDLVDAVPVLGRAREAVSAVPMSNFKPSSDQVVGCRYGSRCRHAEVECFEREPELLPSAPGRQARCLLVNRTEL